MLDVAGCSRPILFADRMYACRITIGFGVLRSDIRAKGTSAEGVVEYRARSAQEVFFRQRCSLRQKTLGPVGLGEPCIGAVPRDRPGKHEHGNGDKRGRMRGLVWRRQRRWQPPESLLLPLARALADLVCTEDFTCVKACEGPGCTLLFLDRTQGRARRWCSMAVCGNRAKQAARRKRAQQTRRRPK
jgi:CGNR zinc finger